MSFVYATKQEAEDFVRERWGIVVQEFEDGPYYISGWPYRAEEISNIDLNNLVDRDGNMYTFEDVADPQHPYSEKFEGLWYLVPTAAVDGLRPGVRPPWMQREPLYHSKVRM